MNLHHRLDALIRSLFADPTESAVHPLRRALGGTLIWVVAWGLLALGWLVLLGQSSLLWQRLPPEVLERFVPDRVNAPLPQLPKLEALADACAQPPAGWQSTIARIYRSDITACLSNPLRLKQGAEAQAASQRYQAQVEQQVREAQVWLSAYGQQAPATRQALQAELQRLQTSPLGRVSPLYQRVLDAAPEWVAPRSVRESVGPRVQPDAVAREIEAKVARTQAKLRSLEELPQPERLRELALLATGQQLGVDYGKAPPQMRLMSAPHTLIATLNTQRLQRNYATRGMSLQRWQALPLTLALSGAVLLLVALLTGAGLMAALAWVSVSQLLGAGALLLTDLALNGPAAMRYFVERQYFGFEVGSTPLPLTLNLGGVDMLWLPLVLVAAALLALRALRDGGSLWLAPLHGWVHAGADGIWGSTRLLVLVLVGLVAWLGLGMAAAVSELLIFLGCIGLASYLARQAAHANMGAGIQWAASLTVFGGLLAGVGLSFARGDLGHALVALLLAGCFTWLFGARWLRWLMAGAVATVTAMLAASVLAGQPVWPMDSLLHWLPAHAQSRVMGMFQPFEVNSSDMARILWMMHSGGFAGWGLGYAPWLGLSGNRLQDGIPLQGPSDYVLSLVSTVWGWSGGLWLMALVLLVFTVGAGLGLRTALRAGITPTVRALAALGGLGCVMMAGKVVLSVGGVGRVLPLTGLPVSLLGYGPITHLAALFYLALALGTAHVRAPARKVGIRLADKLTMPGGLRTRGSALAALGLVLLGLLLGGVALRNLRDAVGTDPQLHLSRQRHAVATAVAQSLLPLESAPTPTQPLACLELGYAVAAWNAELTQLARPVRVSVADGTATQVVTALYLDGHRLLTQLEQAREQHPEQRVPSCKALARQLGDMLDTDLPRLVGRQKLPSDTTSPQALFQQAFERPRLLGASKLDFSTTNAWWGVPGCVLPLSGWASGLPEHCPRPSNVASTSTQVDLRQLVADTWLQRQLSPQLLQAMRQPQGKQVINHHRVPAGGPLGLTLEPRWQTLAQKVVDCYTGHVRGADCAAVLPRDPAWQARHFEGPDALRAGAAGLVLTEVDSGRIVALAGALSDCSLKHLTRDAVPETNGQGQPQWPALLPGERCAQLPDRRMLYAVGTEHPLLWRVPPGSTVKPLVVAAGIDAGLITPADEARWKAIIAESHERTPVQSTALAAGQRFLDVLHGAGFGAPPLELLWGQPPANDHAPLRTAAWRITAYDGTQNLRPTTMTLEESEAIRAQKLRGVDVDRQLGEAKMREFLMARSIADQSLGASDIRMSTLGLVDMWRQLDLRARQQGSSRPLHLLEKQTPPTPSHSLEWLSPQAAQRVLGITSGVTASGWKGSAQGSCRRVFGACPAEGLPGVSGKTGTADFLTQDEGPYAKPGLQLPSKLFGGVFTAADGKRYAVAAITLRVRDGDKPNTLEYGPSASADAALTLMREMGVNNPAARPAR